MSERLILVGAGSFGRELISWAEHAGRGESFAGYLDKNPGALAGHDYDVPWLGTPADYDIQPGDRFVIGLAAPAAKRAVVASLRARGALFRGFSHPSAIIARTAVLGEGVILCPFALVSADTVVGEFVGINAMSSIGHDVELGAYSTLSAHVDLTGGVKVGEEVFFGTGARVLPDVKVGHRAKIGAGTTIFRSVSDDATMYTTPAKRL